MEFRQNEQLQLAADFVRFTGKNIFLTGKAGTGKTTFLHQLRTITPKRFVVVAPTGVAAMNAGGVTIHSFFQLSFAPSIPEPFRKQNSFNGQNTFIPKFHREKINLIKCLDLLVIDEISMVRADVLDAVDEVLRRFRHPKQPFGGVQVLMIGDLHQLSPVVKDNEWSILRDYYPSIYFFDSHALRRAQPITIELTENFRQSDAKFIALLNKVRENELDPHALQTLNERYQPGFRPQDDQGFITLTTHNNLADEINRSRLKELPGKSYVFQAELRDDFPPYLFPTEEKLELKKGAQVMFMKNDLSVNKLFYNGKIGKIIRLDPENIVVKCPGDQDEIEVPRMQWDNTRYTVNGETKEITEEVAGTFIQYPLRLAWAITIHKSQGLTFDKVIIDAAAAFAFGQVYVALSRCRTFEGIVLSTPISSSGIKTDALVAKYTFEAQQQPPGHERLTESKRQFQEELIVELFDFKSLRFRFDALLRAIKEHANSLDSDFIRQLQQAGEAADTEIFRVGEKFQIQLQGLMKDQSLPEENAALQARITQASVYFSEKLKTRLISFFQHLSPETDNKEVRTTLMESIEKVERESFIRHACLETAKPGFDTIGYLKTRSKADVDFRTSARAKSSKSRQSATEMAHPELYYQLRDWRDNLADVMDVPSYNILPRKTMLELLKRLPVNPAALKTVPGIGKARNKRFGTEITGIIREYCEKHKIMT